MPVLTVAQFVNKNKPEFFLTARDSTGYVITITVYLTFVLPPTPKYVFQFSLSPFDLSNIDIRITFMDKLALFREESTRKSVGYDFISSTRIDYFNCSVSYSPCDMILLKQIKASYSTDDDTPTQALHKVMLPQFNIGSVSSASEAPCGNPHPPIVKVIPPIIKISICGIFYYTIPENTFYDNEEGNSRNLKISLKVKSTSSFSMTNFVKYTSTTQTIRIIPSVRIMQSQSSTEFKFSLTARDQSLLTAVTDLTFKIHGPYSILNECQIQVLLTKSVIIEFEWSDFEIMEFIISRLKLLFNLKTEEIGIVTFYSLGANQFYFSWSYCSPNYHTTSYQSNSANLEVDYVNFQAKILMILFNNDRKTISVSFKNAFISYYSVTKVKTKFTVRCKNLPPIIPSTINDVIISISYGGYYTHIYQNNYFYDFEDGWAYSLKITLVNFNDGLLLIDNWINVDVTTHTIYAVVTDYIRYATDRIWKFYLRASDSSGQTTNLKITVIRDSQELTFAPFNITYLLRYDGPTGLIYANQSSYIINKIVGYFPSISTPNFVLIRWYLQSSGYQQYRGITWSVAGQTCSSTVLATIRSIYSRQGMINLFTMCNVIVHFMVGLDCIS